MESAIFGLIGVLLGAVLTTLSNLWLGHRSSRKKAEYLAIRVSCIFDRYVDGCVAVVQDDGLLEGQPNPDGTREDRVPTPELEIQKIDVDWQSLPSELMYEILSFPNRIEEADQKIDIVATYEAFPPDYEEAFEERQFQYSILGIQAAEIAGKLRKKYCIPARSFESWNPIEFMEKNKTEILNLRTQRQKEVKTPFEIND